MLPSNNNPFHLSHKSFPLNSLPGSIWTAFTDLVPDLLSTGICLFQLLLYTYFLCVSGYVCQIKLATLIFSVHVKLFHCIASCESFAIHHQTPD